MHERNLSPWIPLPQVGQPRSAQWLNRIPIKTSRTSKAHSRVGQLVTDVPRIVAVIGVILLAFAGVFSLGGLMISQVNQLASDLPRYQSTLREKIQNLRGAGTCIRGFAEFKP
jgi:predicted PurR-regulated permease PerM